MEIQALFQKTRELLNDLGFNSNVNNSDQFFNDGNLIGHLNMAFFDFDFKTQYNQVGYEDTQYNFSTVANQSLYKLPFDIIRVKSVMRDNFPMYETSYNANQGIYLVPKPNVPSFFNLNYKDKTILLNPVPDGVYNISFRGNVSSPVFDLSDLNKEIPLPLKYHEFFKYYIASKCLEFMDNDSGNIKMSGYFMGQWNAFTLQVKDEITRRTNNIINITNDSYNAW